MLLTMQKSSINLIMTMIYWIICLSVSFVSTSFILFNCCFYWTHHYLYKYSFFFCEMWVNFITMKVVLLLTFLNLLHFVAKMIFSLFFSSRSYLRMSSLVDFIYCLMTLSLICFCNLRWSFVVKTFSYLFVMNFCHLLCPV